MNDETKSAMIGSILSGIIAAITLLILNMCQGGELTCLE